MKVCPQCSTQGRCTDSRPGDDYTRRRYHCACGHTWTTAEFLVSEGPKKVYSVVETFKERKLSELREEVRAELHAVVDRRLNRKSS